MKGLIDFKYIRFIQGCIIQTNIYLTVSHTINLNKPLNTSLP